jgi:hypothetical protein
MLDRMPDSMDPARAKGAYREGRPKAELQGAPRTDPALDDRRQKWRWRFPVIDAGGGTANPDGNRSRRMYTSLTEVTFVLAQSGEASSALKCSPV